MYISLLPIKLYSYLSTQARTRRALQCTCSMRVKTWWNVGARACAVRWERKKIDNIFSQGHQTCPTRILNKITQGDVNIFSHFTSYLDISAIFFVSNWLNIIKFVISRSILVKLDTSIALFKKTFSSAILNFFSKRRSTKHRKTTFYLVCNVEKNRR